MSINVLFQVSIVSCANWKVETNISVFEFSLILSWVCVYTLTDACMAVMNQSVCGIFMLP